MDAYRGNRSTRGSGRNYREPYLERAEAYWHGAKATGQSNPRVNKPMSQSTKTYKKEKEERFRQTKGAEVIAELHTDLKKSLLCGFDNIEAVIKAREYEDAKRQIALPVSTRTAGFATVTTISKVQSTEANRARLPEMTQFQMYRVLLAMLEKKVFDNRIVARLDDRELWYNPAPFEVFKTSITSINICPQQIGALLKSMSSFKYTDTNFVPLFPAAERDNQNRLVPIPENVHLTNLREVVTSLSNADTPLAIRRNFINKNPIPGAIFIDNVLNNPDDVMPAAYGAEQLIVDIYAVKGWLEYATDLKGVREKWFARVDLIERTLGNESMLVSSDSEDLRIHATRPNDRRLPIVSEVRGNVTQFWVRNEIGMQMTFYGTYHLGGERASHARYLYPRYCVRTKEACGIETKRSYMEVVLAVEN